MNNIHRTAIIGDNVRLGSNNSIGPYAVIIGNVVIGDNNWIGPHTSIGGPAEIRNAELPKDWESGDHRGTVTIGSHNVIRDACVIHAGFYTGTQIANECYIMNQTYVAHDCKIENQVTLSSHVSLGGHATIQTGANLGMGTVVHQRRVVGAGCMIGMGAVVTKDLMPFLKAYGSPAKARGGNVIGMQRANLDDALISKVVEALNDSDMESLRRLIPDEMTAFVAAEASQQH
jgi:UDP-N-acetylglucosamine acyltransferase